MLNGITIIYAIVTVISLLLLISYCGILKKRDIWLTMLYIAVFIVNAGYLSLSVSKTVEEALLANRISYLGSAFLPLCMLMTIVNVCKIKWSRVFAAILIPVSCAMFIITATPGYLDCYYKSVTLSFENGLTTLIKEYGPLHNLYFVYLVTYFGIMLAVIAYSIIRKRITSGSHVTILASAVLVNIAVWGIEKIVDSDFEFLSITYIITELFLLMLYIMLQGSAEPKNVPEPVLQIDNTEEEKEELSPIEKFEKGIATLTVTERRIFDLYLAGKNTKETAEAIGIKENTLKFHNKNIYSKLGVSSKKELLYYALKTE